MTARTRLIVFLVSTPLVALVTVGGLMGGDRPARAAQRALPHLAVMEDARYLIEHAYVEKVDVDKVMDGAMRGLIDGLDPSSAYLVPDEVKAMETKTPLPAGDVGIIVTRQFYLRIVGVRDGSPAAKAGLQTGDFVRAIDNFATRDLSAYAGQRLLRGAPGSKVTLLIIRGNAADPHPIELTREPLSTERVTSRKLPSGQTLVRISSFGDGAVAALKSEVEALGDAGKAGLAIDLRGTADGTPDDGIAAARLFVKSGTLAVLAGRKGAERKEFTAAAGDGVFTMPVVLMVSNGTANAAEVFAAALSRNKRTTLVGEPTAGIAAVQRLVKLPEGHGLWMTYARYLKADDKPLHEQGLMPDDLVDIPVIPFDAPAAAPNAVDPLLSHVVKAFEIWKGK
jgi:carboxyl-terminal processing protease